MLIILCTVNSEARPLIDGFRLKKVEDSPFPIYQNETIALCITGIGSSFMAAAIGYMGGRCRQSLAWLNFGIAASLSEPLYSLVMPSEVQSTTSLKRIYPSYPFKPKVPLKTFWTHDTPQKNLSEDCIVDMEAYTFFQIASKFSPLELIHSVKCISDRGVSSFREIDQEALTTSLRGSFPLLENLTGQLLTLQSDHFPEETPPLAFFSSKWNLSVTEKFQLKALLLKTKALQIRPEIIEEIFNHSSSFSPFVKALSHQLQIKEIPLQ